MPPIVNTVNAVNQVNTVKNGLFLRLSICGRRPNAGKFTRVPGDASRRTFTFFQRRRGRLKPVHQRGPRRMMVTREISVF